MCKSCTSVGFCRMFAHMSDHFPPFLSLPFSSPRFLPLSLCPAVSLSRAALRTAAMKYYNKPSSALKAGQGARSATLLCVCLCVCVCVCLSLSLSLFLVRLSQKPSTASTGAVAFYL